MRLLSKEILKLVLFQINPVLNPIEGVGFGFNALNEVLNLTSTPENLIELESCAIKLTLKIKKANRMIVFIILLIINKFYKSTAIKAGYDDSDGRNLRSNIDALNSIFIEIWNHRITKIGNLFSFVNSGNSLMLKTA